MRVVSVRLAAVGASATVDFHGQSRTYVVPEEMRECSYNYTFQSVD